MQLKQIAHARTGDKGNTVNISVIVYDPKDYPYLVQHLTSERVKSFFADLVKGVVSRYELPDLGALNFVLQDALAGGVTRSLALDKHGKSLAFALLEIDLSS